MKYSLPWSGAALYACKVLGGPALSEKRAALLAHFSSGDEKCVLGRAAGLEFETLIGLLVDELSAALLIIHGTAMYLTGNALLMMGAS